MSFFDSQPFPGMIKIVLIMFAIKAFVAQFKMLRGCNTWVEALYEILKFFLILAIIGFVYNKQPSEILSVINTLVDLVFSWGKALLSKAAGEAR